MVAVNFSKKRALKPLNAESRKRALPSSHLRIDEARQLLQNTCNKLGNTIGRPRPPGIGRRQLRFERHRIGTESISSLWWIRHAKGLSWQALKLTPVPLGAGQGSV